MTKETQKTLRRFLRTSTILLGVLSLAVIILAVGFVTNVIIRNHVQNNTITVTGVGKAQAVPDEGTISFGVRAEDADQNKAQEEVEESVSKIIEDLEEKGISEGDVKLQNYNVYPRYDYIENVCVEGERCISGERVLSGYEVNQSIVITIKDIEISGEILALLGNDGATNINGPHFVVEDKTVYEQEARAEAISNARAEAKSLAKQLDVKLGKMVDFYEDNNYGGPMPYFAKTMSMDAGMAEEMAFDEVSIPVGEEEVQVNVTMTFKIR